MIRLLARCTIAAVGSAIVASACTGCAGNQAVNTDSLLTVAVQSIVNADKIAFQGVTQTSVGGFSLPEAPLFVGQASNGKQVVLSTGPEPAAAGNEQRPQPSQNHSLVLRQSENGQWAVSDAATPADADALSLIRWNPLPWLERLPQLKQQVVTDRKQSDSTSIAVRVDADSAQVHKLVEAQLREEYDRLQQKLQRELEPPASLPAKQAVQRRSELQTVMSSASAQLEQMLATLKADGSLTFWIDRSTNRASKFMLTTKLRYQNGGQEREETSQTVYSFGENGKQVLLP